MRDFDLVVPSDCAVSNSPEENEGALQLMRKFLKAKTPSSKEMKFTRRQSPQVRSSSKRQNKKAAR
jgi:hypothetical protein